VILDGGQRKFRSVVVQGEIITKVALHVLLPHKKNFTQYLLITETAHYH
jgi:hypothetical protein